jgi:hypothetical protein
MTLARCLARKAVKEEWRAQGRKVQYIHPSEITKASNRYLEEHRNELMMEAAQRFICGTPFETRARQERWKTLVKEAIRAEGGKVVSIAPADLRKLVEAFLQENPERRFG